VFDDLIARVNQLSQQGISIPIETDEKGYLDRQCPSVDCEFFFKVNEEDWANIVTDEAVWCPFCRHEAPAKQWFSKAQVEHARKQALMFLEGEVHNALVSGAQEFNRAQPKNSFISMSMKVSGGPVVTAVIPAKAAEEMQLEITCEQCQTRFAVIGSAYFCPACGHNSVTRTYSDSLRKIRVKLDSIELVRKAISEASGKDAAEVTCRSLLESCLSDGVVAFQKFCDGLYAKYGTASTNVFQRIDQGSELWVKALGKGYDSWLAANEIEQLKVLYQKRHILAHNEGIVDSQYLAKSGDTAYKDGQRIVVGVHDVEALLDYLDRLGAGLQKACDDASSPAA
jgi:uncharacterized Zn finger protein (UPF0148 family)